MRTLISKVAGAALLVVAAATGCASATASPAAGTPGAVAASTSTPFPGAPAGATVVTVEQNGSTVHVAVGGVVSLVSFPSSWLPTSSDPAVLADPATAPVPIVCRHPMGSDCPLPAVNFTAKAKGTARLTAHRNQCGEARPCGAPDAKDFVLTVVVD